MNKQYPYIPICQNASENTEVREILTNLSLTYGKKFFTPDDKDLLCKMPCSLEDISMHPKIIKHSGKSKPKKPRETDSFREFFGHDFSQVSTH